MPKPLDLRIRNREKDSKRRAEKPWRAWYGTPRWKAMRARQLQQHPLCARCLKQGRIVPATVAHHVIKHEGDAHLFWNGKLASSCKPCHDALEQQAEAIGYDTEVGADGLPSDPNHPFNR